MNVCIMSKDHFQVHLYESKLIEYHYSTPAGTLLVNATKLGIYKAVFIDDQILPSKYNNKPSENLIITGTNFQISVLKMLLTIPIGITINYFDLATLLGQPKSYRAVANALAQNNIAYFIPCHRVIRKNGSLGGYR